MGQIPQSTERISYDYRTPRLASSNSHYLQTSHASNEHHLQTILRNDCSCSVCRNETTNQPSFFLLLSATHTHTHTHTQTRKQPIKHALHVAVAPSSRRTWRSWPDRRCQFAVSRRTRLRYVWWVSSVTAYRRVFIYFAKYSIEITVF